MGRIWKSSFGGLRLILNEASDQVTVSGAEEVAGCSYSISSKILALVLKCGGAAGDSGRNYLFASHKEVLNHL